MVEDYICGVLEYDVVLIDGLLSVFRMSLLSLASGYVKANKLLRRISSDLLNLFKTPTNAHIFI
jgi:hypothetical protein